VSEFRRYYWDSSVFCSFLGEEENRCQVVNDLLNEAQAGRLEVVTSSFSLVEVLKLKGHKPVTQEEEDKLRTFFEYPFITLVNADRHICEASRIFVWKYGVKSKDAVHMATADAASRIVPIHGLFSWDRDFIKLDGKTGLSMRISHPFIGDERKRVTESGR
jgi:predicted nucleic acid-binding protein